VNQSDRRQAALDYLAERTGTLEYRFLRYAAVADELFARGLDDDSLLADLGAGRCDFDFYLRAVRGWKGRYLPVDASIDGVNLDDGWHPRVGVDFAVAIELLEHLRRPQRLVRDAVQWARVFVATTPNTDELGDEHVRKIDRTHVRPIFQGDLANWGADVVEVRSFFGKPNDSLLAVWEVGS
jgi:hypothetical protein